MVYNEIQVFWGQSPYTLPISTVFPSLNQLGEARDWTCILIDTSWVLNPLSHNGYSPPCPFWMSLSLLSLPPRWLWAPSRRALSSPWKAAWPSSSRSTSLVAWRSSFSLWWPMTAMWPSVSPCPTWPSWSLECAAWCWQGPAGCVWGGWHPYSNTASLHVSDTFLWSHYQRALYRWSVSTVEPGLHGHPPPGPLSHPQQWGDVWGHLPYPHLLLCGHPLLPEVLQLWRLG